MSLAAWLDRAAALLGGGDAARRNITSYAGLADASAVTRVGDRIIVATDEVQTSSGRNALHIYTLGNPHGTAVEMTPALGADQQEADLEGVARLGDRQFWIGSHSTSSKGEVQPGRHVLFATTLQGETLVPLPGVYRTLLADLGGDARYAGFDLAAAARRAPETDNGLSIEGLTARGTTLLIGLRSPVTDGMALIVPLLNAPAVVAGTAKATFGAPLPVDLGGRGIRDMASIDGATLILAGPAGNKGSFRLFVLDGSEVRKGPKVDFGDMHVEGMTSAADGSLIFVSDDGDVKIGGKKARKLPDSQRRFRVLTVKP
jgi:hypothetical protein